MMPESSTLLLNLEEKEVRALNLVVLLVCGGGLSLSMSSKSCAVSL